MTSNFHAHIRSSLADANLQVALDANAERRVRVRKSAFESLDNPLAMRQEAHAVRAKVIDHLDEYLTRFCQQAQEHGMIIHHAEDARKAVEIVLEIAQQNGASLIAKSKTMVSEEIELNHALEAAGVRVVETDLGEYIVQLRGETPSHIITPAVHLRRADVGRLFEEKLGLPYTEDIPIMTTTARQVLRDVFLNADIGISGVNFAVAETGALCILTNEGNGRMVTTLPKVHIALLGMERLVPNLDDLALMLRLLPRSATGQKLTVYTSLLHSPRRTEDPDGPMERHVVIVDNGRKHLRETPLAEMLYCIRCGACLNACPVFREIGGHSYVGVNDKGSPYPGPMGSVLAPGLFGQAEFGHLARASTLCGACREACPVDIDLPQLLLRVRAGLTEVSVSQNNSDTHSAPNPPWWLAFGLKLFTWTAEHPRRFRLLQKVAGRVMGGKGWLRLPTWSGWGYSKDFPRPAQQSFQQRWSIPSGVLTKPGDTPVIEGGDKGKIIAPQREMVPRIEDAQAPISPDQNHKTGLVNHEALMQQFKSELAELGTQLIQCQEGEVGEVVRNLLQGHDCQEILAWESPYLPDGLLTSLREAGIQIVHPHGEDKMHWGSIRVGLTGAIGATAETGSIAIPGGPGRPLVTSLLPEVHIVLVHQGTLHARLDELLRLPQLSQSAAAVLISGPSRTADIEMTLTIGVHGPGELIVIAY